MDSVNSNAAAKSPLFSSPAGELNSIDMILTRAGSASAFSRNATWSASSSLIGPEATGAQHTGADMSMVGRALGTNPVCH
ncbi:hypothetical protein MPP7335_04268 [Mycolicibacterium parafortuitum]|uniref:Uncharacterized protein n=1 Tax=Mycolicibacterium parafortuitum TaxID=39692 RepID=A0A375YMX2_MYCPF|nr:hypothetical protein MPP7335_04268 [Mycolicibacterium parafortuitum]